MTKSLGCLFFLAVASPGCAHDCEWKTSMVLVVPGEEACPSLAKAETAFKAHGGDGTVDRLEKVTEHPPTIVCWYRVEEDASCSYPSREELLPDEIPRSGMFACDTEGRLYGEPLPADADECPASIVSHGWVTVTTFVGSDDYAARKECVYETSYPSTCGGGIPMGLK